MSLIEAAGASGVLVQGDVADAVAAESLVKEAAQQLGGCDIFVQRVAPRAGEIHEHVMSTELPLEKWQLAFNTQARVFFAWTAAKFMCDRGNVGLIMPNKMMLNAVMTTLAIVRHSTLWVEP